MCSKGFTRRVLPFFATFAAGLFIASFFVSIGGPTFRGRGWERHRQFERLRIENDELRNENLRLKNELESHDWMPSDLRHTETWTSRGPEFPVVDVPPPPPPAPVAPRTRR